MPRELRSIRVFVAGPSDVDDERRQLEDVVDELNVTWSDTLGVRLDLLTWRTRAQPGVGVDAQDVVNRTMPQDYDIFVGIMWSRFGSPTARAGSGTEEEFNRALERSRASSAVHLMMYFKDDAVAPSRIDPDQVARVQAFQKRLESEGVLYWNFTSPFEATVRVHLAREIQAWVNERRKEDSIESANVDDLVESEPDEPGLIDSGDLYLQQMATFGDARSRVVAAIVDLVAAVVKDGPEMERTSGMDGVRRLMEWRAELLERLVKRLRADIPTMAESFEAAMDSLGRTIALAGEVGLGDSMKSPTWAAAQAHAAETIESDIQQIVSIREGLANTGRFTTRLNRAKRAALAEIDRLLELYRHQSEAFAQVVPTSAMNEPPDSR